MLSTLWMEVIDDILDPDVYFGIPLLPALITTSFIWLNLFFYSTCTGYNVGMLESCASSLILDVKPICQPFCMQL